MVACLDVVGRDVGTVSVAVGISRTAVRVAHHRVALTRIRNLVPATRQAPVEAATTVEPLI